MGLNVIQDKRRQGHNQSGFTIIELIMAMVIIFIVMLGLLTLTAQVAEVSVRDIIRDEAVRVAEEIMDQERAKPFDEIRGTPSPIVKRRNIRNVPVDYSYDVDVSGSEDAKIITVRMSWYYRGNQYTHNISSIVRIKE